MVNNVWIRKDGLQWIKKNNGVFEVVNAFNHLDVDLLGNSIQIVDSEIDLNKYEEELSLYLPDTFDSLTDFRDFYGTESNEVLAQLISEDEAINTDTMNLYTLDGFIELLELDYGFDVTGLKEEFEQCYASNSKKHNRNTEMDM